MIISLQLRRPPSSTLFPTRRSSDLCLCFLDRIFRHQLSDLVFDNECRRKLEFLSRSEEHTSELQSRQYLVCRLLLEKKKYSLYDTPGVTMKHCNVVCCKCCCAGTSR